MNSTNCPVQKNLNFTHCQGFYNTKAQVVLRDSESWTKVSNLTLYGNNVCPFGGYAVLTGAAGSTGAVQAANEIVNDYHQKYLGWWNTADSVSSFRDALHATYIVEGQTWTKMYYTLGFINSGTGPIVGGGDNYKAMQDIINSFNTNPGTSNIAKTWQNFANAIDQEFNAIASQNPAAAATAFNKAVGALIAPLGMEPNTSGPYGIFTNFVNIWGDDLNMGLEGRQFLFAQLGCYDDSNVPNHLDWIALAGQGQ